MRLGVERDRRCNRCRGQNQYIYIAAKRKMKERKRDRKTSAVFEPHDERGQTTKRENGAIEHFLRVVVIRSTG